MAKATIGDKDKDFIKKYGDYITTGDKILEIKRNYKTISISPAIDLALGGGIKEGSWVILSGPPKAGKTTTTMQIIANCQAEGRKIIYLDVEGRLKEMNFEVPGIDPSLVQVIRSGDTPLAAEEFLEIARTLLSSKENEGCVLVIDSISSLIPKRDLEVVEIDGQTRPGLPKILSDFCKKLGQTVPNNKCIVVMITHMITNTSGYGKSRMADGGVKIQFQADTRMEVKSVSPWNIGSEEKKDIIGLKVTWDILCSSIGSPHKTCESWIRFGQGIDKIQEIITIAIDLGLIEKSGSWFNLVFLEEKAQKFQGQEKVNVFLAENKDAYATLEVKVREMLY
jgi:recombination protein RecA